MNTGVYVHIPFCTKRCPFCDFATYESKTTISFERYFSILEKEISYKSNLLKKANIVTVFFGGGTPSLVPAKHIGKVLDLLRSSSNSFIENIEITIEINPGTLNDSKLKEYESFGVNRLSLGVQTFNKFVLESIGRNHSIEDTYRTLDLISKGPIDNFSLDLMFGLTNQTLDNLVYDLNEVLKIDPNHVSAYLLTISDENRLNKGRPDENTQVEMFNVLWDQMESNYNQYEISNFSKPNFESKHNLLYWSDENYISFGLGSHSYLKNDNWGVRFWNPRSMQKYENTIINAKTPNGIEYLSEDHIEHLNVASSMSDYSSTLLRRKEGLNLDAMRLKYGDYPMSVFFERLNSNAIQEFLKISENSVRLNKKGKLFSNKVFEELTFLKQDFTQ